MERCDEFSWQGQILFGMHAYQKKKKDKRSDTIGHAHFSLVALNFNI